MAEQESRLGGIDALRGFAALAIVLVHAREILWVGLRRFSAEYHPFDGIGALAGYLSFPLSLGDWRVSLLFVISGFCWHRSRLKRFQQRKQPPKFGAIVLHRIRRLGPLLFLALLFTAACDSLTLLLLGDDPKIQDRSWVTFFANLCFLQHLGFPCYGSNVALWTLSLEMQFALAYPLFWIISQRVPLDRQPALLLGLSLVGWGICASIGTSLNIFLPFWFAWTIGANLAQATATGASALVLARPWLALVCMLVASILETLIAATRDTSFVLPAFLLFAVGHASLLAFAVEKPEHFFWNNPAANLLRGLGQMSFSLYLIHVPLLVLVRAIWYQGEPTFDLADTFIGTGVAVLVGYLFFRTCEVPLGRNREPAAVPREQERLAGLQLAPA